MIETDLLSQLTPRNVPAVKLDDVVDLTRPAPGRSGEEAYLKKLAESYEGLGFLPDYHHRAYREATKAKVTGTITAAQHADENAILAENYGAREERHLNDVRTARRLMRLALRLYDLLQNEETINPSTLAGLGVKTWSTARWSDDGEVASPVKGAIDCEWSVRLPPCYYLDYLQESVSWLSSDSWRADCTLEPESDEDGPLTPLGWASNRSGAVLSYRMHAFPDNKKGYRLAAVTLLSFIQDLHSAHVRVMNYDVGRVMAFSTDVVTQMWVRLRESASGGRVGFCKVCGKPFVATGERGHKHLYCGDPCKQAFNRTRKVLSLVESGKTPEEAKAEVPGISLTRVKDIATRNGLFKDGIDYKL